MSQSDRKPQPKKSNPNRLKFPSNSQEATGWSHIVRFIRLDDEDNMTYRYVRHFFEAMDGQGPYVADDGTTSPRRGNQFAYCLGSQRNPYDVTGDAPVNEEGIAECRSIMLPNGINLHDVDQGGDLAEQALAWCWTTNHLVIVGRKPGWFDGLFAEVKKWGGDMPWYFSKDRPGYDVVLGTVPKAGNFYNYTYSSAPPNSQRNFDDVKALIKTQREAVMEEFNPTETRERMIQRLGLGVAPGQQQQNTAAPPPASGSDLRGDYNGGDDL